MYMITKINNMAVINYIIDRKKCEKHTEDHFL